VKSALFSLLVKIFSFFRVAVVVDVLLVVLGARYFSTTASTPWADLTSFGEGWRLGDDAEIGLERRFPGDIAEGGLEYGLERRFPGDIAEFADVPAGLRRGDDTGDA